MFSTFEHTVDFLYDNVTHKRKQDCSQAQQLGVTCLAGYISGAVGTIVSNPADNIVSSLYNNKANSVLEVSQKHLFCAYGYCSVNAMLLLHYIILAAYFFISYGCCLIPLVVTTHQYIEGLSPIVVHLS
jgi:hypothetical protein